MTGFRKIPTSELSVLKFTNKFVSNDQWEF